MKKMYLFLLCLVLGTGSVFASPVPGIDAESSEFLPPPIDEVWDVVDYIE